MPLLSTIGANETSITKNKTKCKTFLFLIGFLIKTETGILEKKNMKKFLKSEFLNNPYRLFLSNLANLKNQARQKGK